ncbi:MAG: PD-(D/E)XK nuclease family protein, partial [Capnocytophaga sp.]|nr:PD-(D/E)XK nuclease family protein [Capnocytophaga sp.]
MRPNIFDIATKELSQDAFITWLLAYGDEKCLEYDKNLHNCSKELIKRLIRKKNPDFSDNIHKVEAGRQWKNIDIWATIDEKYLIIIEDKTYSSAHSDQLPRYKEIAQNWCDENNYEELICIYIKKGNESLYSLRKIQQEGYHIFSRKDFLDLFAQYKSDNDIFNDFKSHLEKIELSYKEYEYKNINEWNSSDWQGFFSFLEEKEIIRSWEYVNNTRGGFWNGLISCDKKWNGYTIYPQLEQDKFCFKIEVGKKEEQSKVRNEFYRYFMNKLKESNDESLKIKKPQRFGTGTYMTVALVEKQDWLGDGILD